MILSCDPPRHALLIHFGKRQQPRGLQILETSHDGPLVQIALNPSSVPPTLVAVHFVRHNFLLPFVGRPNDFSTDHLHLHWGRGPSRYFFHFEYEPKDYREWNVAPGFTILISEASESLSDWKKRPLLHGLEVDPEFLRVDVDLDEFAFEFGADNLKDVPVTLFVY
jgi:hypothetical protein